MRLNSETVKYYLNDLQDHCEKVADLLDKCRDLLRIRGACHDKTKGLPEEAEKYVPVVWALNHDGPEYGTSAHHELVKTLGPALEHHHAHNDHHPEHFKSDDPLAQMDLFMVLEMVSDWIAAASRHGGDPLAALEVAGRKYPIDPQVKALLTNTVATLCGDEATLGWGISPPRKQCPTCEYDSQCDGAHPDCPAAAV